MALDHVFLVVFGFLLVLLMIGAIVYYYLPKRKDKVEKAKYKMLEDDDE
ncbi:CcoQ/FixQ family Cbb3-type cytochrome c oxidase assembly chaperone [Calditerrivibrio sp.]